MDDDKKTPSDEQPEMLQLPDGLVGETETDDPQLHVEMAMEMVAEAEPKHVSFELPGTSWQGTLQQRQQLDEAKALVKDMIEIMLPRSEPEKDADEATLMQEQTAESAAATATPSPSTSDALRYNDARLQRILRLLDRYTRNLEAIEEHVQSANSGQRSTVQLDGNTELQVTQHCELATQTLPVNSLRLDVTSTFRPKSHIRSSQQQPQQPQHQQQQQQLNQQVDIMPPCERRYHTITISTNSSSAFAAPARPRTLLGRIGQTLGDFAGAFCLCLQVNKDCVFCLGFFIAFVISASFLTAFFYRTINLTQTQLRVPLEGMENTPATTSDMVTLRFNGGYYYIYNSQRQHFV